MKTEVKERPILFSGPMVRAILAGKKTQTRRVVRQVPTFLHLGRPIMDWPLSGVYEDDDGRTWLDVQTDVDDCSHDELNCPYGVAGDRLWVRETWLPLDSDHWGDSRLPKDAIISGGNPRRNGYAYRAECSDDSERIRQQYGYKWRPSIFMPREACRLTLEITDVRVERLQEISESDAISEGLEVQIGDGTGPGAGFKWNGPGYWGGNRQQRVYKTYHVRFPWKPQCSCKVGLSSAPVCAFAELWDKLNGPRGYGWDSNPWVWVVSFKRVEP